MRPASRVLCHLAVRRRSGERAADDFRAGSGRQLAGQCLPETKPEAFSDNGDFCFLSFKQPQPGAQGFAGILESP